MENRSTSILRFHMDITCSPSLANAVLIVRGFDEDDNIDNMILNQNIGYLKNDFFIYYKVLLSVDSTITVITVRTLCSSNGTNGQCSCVRDLRDCGNCIEWKSTTSWPNAEFNQCQKSSLYPDFSSRI